MNLGGKDKKAGIKKLASTVGTDHKKSTSTFHLPFLRKINEAEPVFR